MKEFKRDITISAAHDNRREGYGVNGCDMIFILTGSMGAVQFILCTNWHLPSVDMSMWSKESLKPMPAYLGYHSPKPMYEGQSAITHECEFLEGKPCYYDGSALNAGPVYERLVSEGSEGVWKALEAYYEETFGSDA